METRFCSFKQTQEPIEPEVEPLAELPEPKRRKIFFMDWFFGIEPR